MLHDHLTTSVASQQLDVPCGDDACEVEPLVGALDVKTPPSSDEPDASPAATVGWRRLVLLLLALLALFVLLTLHLPRSDDLPVLPHMARFLAPCPDELFETHRNNAWWMRLGKP